VAIGYLATVLIPGLPLAAGMLLGAIVSPPDAIAVTGISQRLRLPRQLITIIEGESLINDATALVAYRFAVAAAVAGGTFSIPKAAATFFVIVIGGIAIGFVVALIVVWLLQRLDDPAVQTTLTLLTPFLTYIA